MTTRDYVALAEFRLQLRRFLQFSTQSARSFDLEPAQHQLLLATRALGVEQRTTIGALAEQLALRHHSVVGLVDRLEQRGMVARCRAVGDRRQILVTLTDAGEEVLRKLSAHHRQELRVAGPALVRALEVILESCGGEDAVEVEGRDAQAR
jgi:DNA-binding MarR family transcriptional regulator